MLNVTMRQLRYFDALARHGHFGRAAHACAISQPALSMQIKELEDALGGVLLERNARQVVLTRFGEELADRVRDILRSVDELGDFARASRDRLAGRTNRPHLKHCDNGGFLEPAVCSGVEAEIDRASWRALDAVEANRT